MDFYRDALIETAQITHASSSSIGSVLNQLKFEFNIGNSKIKQLVSLHPNSKRLDLKPRLNGWKIITC